MSDVNPIQVLIVGAGPTGLALACHCRQLGLRVRLVEKKPGPSTTSKAIGLQYRVSEVLACMGVADRFLAQGGAPTVINVYARDRRLARLQFRNYGYASGRDAFAPRSILIPQSRTEALLAELLAERGGAVEWDTEFLDFEQTHSGVFCRLRRPDGDEEEVATDWLVSCEGAHSIIRKQAGVAFGGTTYPLAFFMADVEVGWPRDHGDVHVWVHPDGSFAALPLPGEKTWRLFVEVKPQADCQANGLTLDTIRALMAERTGDRTTTVANPTWVSEFRIHCRMVDRYRVGRVLLAGDAAHIHSPTGGQGIATGIQDVTNLAWKLARVVRGAPEALLDTYAEERLPKAQEVLRETNRLTNLLFAPTRFTRLLRDYVLAPVLRSDWVQKRMFAKLAQLHVNYRGCRLARHEDAWWFSGTRLRAGDRAPDVVFRDAATGERRTLFELLHPMRPVALLGSSGSAAEDARVRRLLDALGHLDIDAYEVVAREASTAACPNCLIDTHGDFRRMYGMTGEFLCLIRPDDHVGLIQRPINEPALRDYLMNLCPADGCLSLE